MKIKMIVCSMLATALLSGCVNINIGDHLGGGKKWEHDEKGEKGEAKNKEASQAKLMAEAKTTKDAAQQTALTKVPNGTIKDSELEKENGKLQWSFDVATPGTADITEVNIDAQTGAVISVAKESAADEAKESAEEAAKAKQGGNND